MCRGQPGPFLYIPEMPENTPDNRGGKKIPRHVAIIMDGNGRWAKERGKPRVEGHYRGAEKISEVLAAARKAGVEFVTLYAFSSENWSRPKDEVDALMSLLSEMAQTKKSEFVENNVRFRTIGDMSALPPKCASDIRALEKLTENFSAQTLVLALNYGSRDELARAVRAVAKDAASGKISPESVGYETIASRLDTAGIPDPDLLVRTSGEMRLSNFLLLQSAYAELYFTKTYWPDFGGGEFLEAVEEYGRRERRYGMTGEQIVEK